MTNILFNMKLTTYFITDDLLCWLYLEQGVWIVIGLFKFFKTQLFIKFPFFDTILAKVIFPIVCTIMC